MKNLDYYGRERGRGRRCLSRFYKTMYRKIHLAGRLVFVPATDEALAGEIPGGKRAVDQGY